MSFVIIEVWLNDKCNVLIYRISKTAREQLIRSVFEAHLCNVTSYISYDQDISVV